MSDRPGTGVHVSPAWVLLGIPVGLLAAADPDGSGMWWVVVSLAGLVWRIPHIGVVLGWVAAAVALVVAGAVAFQAWKRWWR